MPTDRPTQGANKAAHTNINGAVRAPRALPGDPTRLTPSKCAPLRVSSSSTDTGMNEQNNWAKGRTSWRTGDHLWPLTPLRGHRVYSPPSEPPRTHRSGPAAKRQERRNLENGNRSVQKLLAGITRKTSRPPSTYAPALDASLAAPMRKECVPNPHVRTPSPVQQEEYPNMPRPPDTPCNGTHSPQPNVLDLLIRKEPFANTTSSAVRRHKLPNPPCSKERQTEGEEQWASAAAKSRTRRA